MRFWTIRCTKKVPQNGSRTLLFVIARSKTAKNAPDPSGLRPGRRKPQRDEPRGHFVSIWPQKGRWQAVSLSPLGAPILQKTRSASTKRRGRAGNAAGRGVLVRWRAAGRPGTEKGWPRTVSAASGGQPRRGAPKPRAGARGSQRRCGRGRRDFGAAVVWGPSRVGLRWENAPRGAPSAKPARGGPASYAAQFEPWRGPRRMHRWVHQCEY